MTSYVEKETELEFSFDIKEVAEQVMEGVLRMESCPYETQINLLLTDNEGIRAYNARFRQIDRETDVLSFPHVDYEKPSDFSRLAGREADYFDPDSKELVMGDIILSVEKVKEQAIAYNHSEKREFSFLIAHSMLHLCGYDHMEQAEAKVMEEKQEAVLTSLGITREI